MSTRLKRSMRTIMMDGARLLMHMALVAALTVAAGAQQGAAPMDTPHATEDTFLAEPVAGKRNLEPGDRATSTGTQGRRAPQRAAAAAWSHTEHRPDSDGRCGLGRSRRVWWRPRGRRGHAQHGPARP